jgi:hypothetical protein
MLSCSQRILKIMAKWTIPAPATNPAPKSAPSDTILCTAIPVLFPQNYHFPTLIKRALHGSPYFWQLFLGHLHIPQAVTCSWAPKVFLPCVLHFALLWCTNVPLAAPCVPASQTGVVWHLGTPFLLHYTVSYDTEKLNWAISKYELHWFPCTVSISLFQDLFWSAPIPLNVILLQYRKLLFYTALYC